jgi:hypothetical protein
MPYATSTPSRVNQPQLAESRETQGRESRYMPPGAVRPLAPVRRLRSKHLTDTSDRLARLQGIRGLGAPHDGDLLLRQAAHLAPKLRRPQNVSHLVDAAGRPAPDQVAHLWIADRRAESPAA